MQSVKCKQCKALFAIYEAFNKNTAVVRHLTLLMMLDDMLHDNDDRSVSYHVTECVNEPVAGICSIAK